MGNPHFLCHVFDQLQRDATPEVNVPVIRALTDPRTLLTRTISANRSTAVRSAQT
jgi:hypothetical protein